MKPKVSPDMAHNQEKINRKKYQKRTRTFVLIVSLVFLYLFFVWAPLEDRGSEWPVVIGIFLGALSIGLLLLWNERRWKLLCTWGTGQKEGKPLESSSVENIQFPPDLGALIQLMKVENRWVFSVFNQGFGDGKSLGLVGFPPYELHQIIHAEHIGLLQHVLDSAVQCRIPIHHECRLANDAEDQWIELIVAPQKTAQGGPCLEGLLLDVQGRKLLEREIQVEKQFVDDLFLEAGVVFMVRRRDHSIHRMNRMFEILSGYTAEELVLDSEMEKTVMGPDYERLIEMIDQVIDGRYPIQFESGIHTRSGEVRQLSWIGTGLKGKDGQITHVIFVGIDITEKNRIEYQLTESLEQLTTVFESSLVGIALIRNKTIVRANQTAARMLGYDHSELEGLDASVFFRTKEEYDLYLQQMFPRIQQGDSHFEYSLIRKDGKSVEFRISVGMIRRDDPDAGCIYVIDDISEMKMAEKALRRSELKFRSILERMASGMAIIDRTGRYLEVNEQWCRITGYTREDARTKSIFDITYPEDCDASKVAIQSILSGQSDIMRIEKRYIRKDGTIIWADLTASFVHESEDPNKKSLISIINDITERKLIQGQLQEANEHLNIEKDRVQILAERQRTQIEIFESLRNATSESDIIAVLSTMLRDILDYRNMMIALMGESNSGQGNYYDWQGEFSQEALEAFFKKPVGLVEEVVQTHLPVLTGMLERWEEFPVPSSDVRSVLVAPMLCKGVLWGIITLDHTESFHFSEEDVSMISAVNALAALQLEDIHARMNLSKEVDQLRMLHEIVQMMSVVKGRDAITAVIEGSKLFEGIWIYKMEAGTPVLCAGTAEKPLSIRTQEKIYEAFHSGMARWKILNPICKNNLAIPIQFENVVQGVLHIGQANPLSEKDIEIASILAEQTASFWALNDLIEKREQEALIDPLTGVWNRRYMIHRLEQEDDRIIRYGSTAAIVILDMGNFKAINDIYGHMTGDEVLSRVAQLLQNGIRKSDFVGRYGGDEFILFMPNADRMAVTALMKRMTDDISGLSIPGLTVILQADFGIACAPEDASTLMEAIKMADEAMYQFKKKRKEGLQTSERRNN